MNIFRRQLVSQVGFGHPVMGQSAYSFSKRGLKYDICSAYSRGLSRFPRRHPLFIHQRVSPEISGRANAYRWRTLLRESTGIGLKFISAGKGLEYIGWYNSYPDKVRLPIEIHVTLYGLQVTTPRPKLAVLLLTPTVKQHYIG